MRGRQRGVRGLLSLKRVALNDARFDVMLDWRMRLDHYLKE